MNRKNSFAEAMSSGEESKDRWGVVTANADAMLRRPPLKISYPLSLRCPSRTAHRGLAQDVPGNGGTDDEAVALEQCRG